MKWLRGPKLWDSCTRRLHAGTLVLDYILSELWCNPARFFKLKRQRLQRNYELQDDSQTRSMKFFSYFVRNTKQRQPKKIQRIFVILLAFLSQEILEVCWNVEGAHDQRKVIKPWLTGIHISYDFTIYLNASRRNLQSKSEAGQIKPSVLTNENDRVFRNFIWHRCCKIKWKSA